MIARLAALAEQGPIESEFYGVLLRELVDATAGIGAALWTCEADGLRLAAQDHLSHSAEPTEDHRTRLEDALARGECRTFRSGDSGTEVLEILCPWRLDEDARGVLELCQTAQVSEAALAGQIRFVCIVADLVVSYRRNRRSADLGRREVQWREIDRFAQAVHRSSDLEMTAYEVANEGRRLVGCDRLAVVVRRRGRWTAVAVSGSDQVNRRAPVVAQLELLAGLVAAGRNPVWSGRDRAELPPELEKPLDDYHDLGSARLVAVLPLSAPSGAEEDKTVCSEPFAVLVVEHFSQVDWEGTRDLCDAICRHSTSALEHALRHEEMPLRRLSGFLDRSRWVTCLRHQPVSVILTISAVAIVLILAMIPAELRVEATGTLQPRTRRHLFAPTDGVVERLLVRGAGQNVGLNEDLIVLRDPRLQFEMEGVRGELEAARKQLAGREAERLHTDRASRGDLREAALRSGEEASLRKQIEGLERQQALLDERREKLRIRSPMNGQLLTWEAEELLQSRPVSRGQVLLTVADLQGEWIVELEIPDDRIADVADAVRSMERAPTARFILATAPETRYLGAVEKVSPATDARGDRAPTVAAIVVPENQEAMRTFRPGASVVAKIDCGRHSLLYVLSRGLLRTIRSRILF